MITHLWQYQFEDEVAAVNDAMTFQYWLEEEATFKSQDNLNALAHCDKISRCSTEGMGTGLIGAHVR